MLVLSRAERYVDTPGHRRVCHDGSAMHGVDNTGHTVTATRFAELTGVSRERLRTWERRHGFPEPARPGGGPRRYRLADVASVVAVREAARAGMPIERAIARARSTAAPAPLGPEGVARLAEHAPVPVAALSGPVPLRVEWVNAVLRALPEGPRAGDELTTALPALHGSALVTALGRLFAGDDGPLEVEHGAWDGTPGRTARSALFRLPPEPDGAPIVAVAGLEGDGERAARQALAELRRELADLRRNEERHTRWLDAIALVSDELRREPGPGVVERGLDLVVRQINAVDGAIASHLGGRLELPRSRRGLLVGAELTVAAYPELARCLRDAEPVWLGPAEAAALGVPVDLRASAMPVHVAGEALGMLVFVFNEVEPHDADNRRVLAAVAGAMGFALLRDRLAHELREAARRGQGE
jgi:MerR family transcriptional regulator, light-induced transcriptional regulator